jgi:hypothetical protein
MLRKVISGGETGVAQAALRAAKAAGLATGGWMPRGWLTAAGPRPELGELYGVQEHPRIAYPGGTRANAGAADATLILARVIPSPGTRLPRREAAAAGKPCLAVAVSVAGMPREVAEWIQAGGVEVLHVTGNPESGDPGIGALAEAFLGDVFALLERSAGSGAGASGTEP